jgi:hypothetical protein
VLDSSFTRDTSTVTHSLPIFSIIVQVTTSGVQLTTVQSSVVTLFNLTVISLSVDKFAAHVTWNEIDSKSVSEAPLAGLTVNDAIRASEAFLRTVFLELSVPRVIDPLITTFIVTVSAVHSPALLPLESSPSSFT